ncbi:MAG TPA: enoyl-CoA hydratase/isomerase family protein, partial [Thermoanaerobaculia bacterium]|nr:enoyl-CoA hydratase/isomerase family protein [Thermoanaerobaculia bacterium]
MTDPTPGFETLTLEVEGELGFLTLNRPDRLNAMNATMLDELVEAASWLDRHLEVRVAIVRGAGRAFCAGADIRAADTSGSPSAPPPGSASWQARREAGQRGLRMTNAIEQMRAVTVAQLHGYAVGGGFLLAVSCDLRVAAEDAVFFIPEVELGIPLTWGGVPRLVRELGPALTKEL